MFKKSIGFAAMVAVSFISDASAAGNFRFVINWNDPRTLSGSITQLCDDTNFPAVDVIIPGAPQEDFFVEMALDVTGGRLTRPGCTVSSHAIRGGTLYRFNAVDGFCQVRVIKRLRVPREPKKEALFEIHDAC